MLNIWTLLQLVPVLILIYYYINKKYSYWSNRGVKGPTPVFPFGYQLSKALNHPDELEKRWAKQYGKVYGVYTGLVPCLTVLDHELIKQVLVKDFHLFVNRRYLNPFHEIWNLNLFFIESNDWKRIRSITSPAFTSGKLKGMYPLMGKCVARLVSYFDKTAKKSGVFDTKEVMSGFTIDVIASSAFATETNANDDRDKPSPFVYHGLNLFKFNPLKLAMTLALPRTVLTSLNITSFFPDNSLRFFIDLTSKIVEQRKANPALKQNDLIQLMMDSFMYEDELLTKNYDALTASMEAEDEKHQNQQTVNSNSSKTKKTLSEKEIIAQCLLFFIAGFETTATTLTHALYELAQNPEVQDRLFEEINRETEKIDQNNMDQYFDTLLNNIPYLDAVVKETLRKYPPVIRLERRVGEDNLKLGGIPLSKGVLIEIPTVAVHHNPEYYPNPDQFNPDRFMPENKHLLVPYTYLPFGNGPRNCIGMRFAYQEIKLAIGTVAQKYQFTPTAQTPDRITIRKGHLLMNCLPFQLNVSAR